VAPGLAEMASSSSSDLRREPTWLGWWPYLFLDGCLSPTEMVTALPSWPEGSAIVSSSAPALIRYLVTVFLSVIYSEQLSPSVFLSLAMPNVPPVTAPPRSVRESKYNGRLGCRWEFCPGVAVWSTIMVFACSGLGMVWLRPGIVKLYAMSALKSRSALSFLLFLSTWEGLECT
jgi:hypothetical protein